MPEQKPSSRRRTFAPVVLLGLAASALTAVASAKPWIGSGTPGGSAQLGTAFDQGTKDPVAAAVSLVLLACWGVLLVTRGVVRRSFAVLATVAALGAVAAVVAGHQTLPDEARDSFERAIGRGAADSGFTAWFWVAGVASLAAVVAGVLAVRLVPHWPQMGTRYDAPADRSHATATDAPETEREMWDALDHGRDPTETRPDEQK